MGRGWLAPSFFPSVWVCGWGQSTLPVTNSLGSFKQVTDLSATWEIHTSPLGVLGSFPVGWYLAPVKVLWKQNPGLSKHPSIIISKFISYHLRSLELTGISGGAEKKPLWNKREKDGVKVWSTQWVNDTLGLQVFSYLRSFNSAGAEAPGEQRPSQITKRQTICCHFVPFPRWNRHQHKSPFLCSRCDSCLSDPSKCISV